MSEQAADGPTDAIDLILHQWARERPDLDLSPMALLGRLRILTRAMERELDEVFDRHGLGQADFDVLATLRRSGPPYALIPSELSAALMMSRAGMTGRLDRLERAGLVERSLDPGDRRSFRVTPTPTGLGRIDTVLTEHAAALRRLVSGLSPEDFATLTRILRTMLAAIT
ncbi:MarR family transcriptional regulator [Spongiactinospora gelatinilytica]|uniref:MarR family transcriptional regulator n=1 Tax=Spongiactinospora gelatinilytica TaxID=2666298 RepID=A0A2W2H5U3_9ACTN|nr:MarR family transcriptional regulator [Spongiactinospora gelatinilytica]PZG56031.1 MarR family transcriptional regulator [Spongiactinospora gelatinilytica]